MTQTLLLHLVLLFTIGGVVIFCSILGFLFHEVPDDEKLSRDDAGFVDVIHSAGLWIGTDAQVMPLSVTNNSVGSRTAAASYVEHNSSTHVVRSGRTGNL